jgi:hypothetical protein
MESKGIAIEQKVPGLYHESQYIIDYLDASLTVDAKSFNAKVNIICNRYLCRNPDRWNATYISGEIIKTYNNMPEDGTWKREIGWKRKTKQEICQTQTQASGLHVLHLWHSSLQTIALKRGKRFN